MSSFLQYPAPKAPVNTLDYTVKFGNWLAGTQGDHLVRATVVATPSDVTITKSFFSPTDVTFFVSGGAPGQLYRFDVEITTQEGRDFLQPVYLQLSK